MNKTILIAGALVVASVGLFGSAAAVPCQSGTSPAGAYNVCVLQAEQIDYQYGYSYTYDCDGNTNIYGYDQSGSHQNAADVNVGAPRAGAYQNHNHYTYYDHEACSGNYDFYQYAYNYDYDYAQKAKNTHIGTNGGLPVAAGLDQNADGSTLSCDYSYSYQYSPDFGGYSGSYSDVCSGNNAYDNTRVNVGAPSSYLSAGQTSSHNAYDDQSSSEYCDSFGCYSSSNSYSYSNDYDFTGAQTGMGPLNAQVGQERSAYAYDYGWASGSGSSKSTGANVNGFFTGLSSSNGGACGVYVMNGYAGACPADAPDIDYMAPEIPDFGPPPL